MVHCDLIIKYKHSLLAVIVFWSVHYCSTSHTNHYLNN